MESSLTSKRIITIPNILSMVRLALIPVFMWLYIKKENAAAAFAVLVASAVTDLADGFIARRFNMVSDLGKALDPIADKLTQAAILLCLAYNFPHLWFLLALLCAKEIITGAMSLTAVSRTGIVLSADWHGKAATAMLYLTMLMHIIWPDVPAPFSVTAAVACAVMMIISFLMYLRRNLNMLKGAPNVKAD